MSRFLNNPFWKQYSCLVNNTDFEKKENLLSYFVKFLLNLSHRRKINKWIEYTRLNLVKGELHQNVKRLYCSIQFLII